MLSGGSNDQAEITGGSNEKNVLAGLAAIALTLGGLGASSASAGPVNVCNSSKASVSTGNCIWGLNYEFQYADLNLSDNYYVPFNSVNDAVPKAMNGGANGAYFCGYQNYNYAGVRRFSLGVSAGTLFGGWVQDVSSVALQNTPC